MHRSRTRRTRRIAAGCCAALAALVLPAAASAGSAPTVKVEGGAVRGATAPGGLVYRGVPYAAAPTGALRWRAPRRAGRLARRARDATRFAPIYPAQPETPYTAGESSEARPLPQRVHPVGPDAGIHGRSHGSPGSTAAATCCRRAEATTTRRSSPPPAPSSSPSTTGSAPWASRPPGAGRSSRRRDRQLRPDGPAGGAAGVRDNVARWAATRARSRSPVSRSAAGCPRAPHLTGLARAVLGRGSCRAEPSRSSSSRSRPPRRTARRWPPAGCP